MRVEVENEVSWSAGRQNLHNLRTSWTLYSRFDFGVDRIDVYLLTGRVCQLVAWVDLAERDVDATCLKISTKPTLT